MPFQPGQSGNPGGRPKGESALKEAARLQTEPSIAVVVAALSDADARVRLKAAEILLDRGWGRPGQAVELSGPDGGPVETVTRFKLADLE